MNRRGILSGVGYAALAHLVTPAAANQRRGEDVMIAWSPTDTYILEDGDGFPAFMHVRHEVRFVDEPWFTGSVYGQPALLFRVVGPEHKGQYIAVWSRMLASIEQQLVDSGMASVAIQLVENPTNTFGQDPEVDLGNGGMTILRRPGDPRFG